MWEGDSLVHILDVCRSQVDRRILRILSNSRYGAYPSQLSRRLGKDRTLVNRRLRHLHDLGLVSRTYEVRDGKGVMVYRARHKGLTITIDFSRGKQTAIGGDVETEPISTFGRALSRLSKMFPPMLPGG